MSRRAPEREALLKKFYLERRLAAYALALSGTLLEEASYAEVKRAMVLAGKRIVRGRFSEVKLLRRLARLKPGARTSDALSPAFKALDAEARRAWALKHGAQLMDEEARRMLSMEEGAHRDALARAEVALGQGEGEAFRALIAGMLARREIWSEVSYDLSRQLRATRYLRLALTSLAACLALLFLAREGWMGIRILRLKNAAPEAVISQSYDNPDFYKRFPTAAGEAGQGISPRLYEQLQPLPDGQLVRVAFRFYDSQLLRSIKQDDQSLMDLYVDMYDEGLRWGKLHRLMANAITLYYGNYERPFMPRERQKDFVSHYASIYDAALELARGTDFEGTMKAFPEFFDSPEGFESYLYSNYFLGGIVPGVYYLLKTEQSLSEDTREEYERLIFAFTNPNGMNSQLELDSFHFFKQQSTRFYSLRESLGKAYYQQAVEQCRRLLPDALLTSDILEGSESSLFSATLSKERILALAEADPRFHFLGIAAPYSAASPDRLEHGLADLASRELFERRPVYQIDEVFQQYAINYAAPLRLPQGFIDELRQLRACKDTQFEWILKYDYHLRFAHPQQRSGYSLLRAVYGNPALQFSSADFKSFMAISH